MDVSIQRRRGTDDSLLRSEGYGGGARRRLRRAGTFSRADAGALVSDATITPGGTMLRVTAAAGTLRAVAAVTTGVVEEARRRHGTYPTATAALGRTLTAGLL